MTTPQNTPTITVLISGSGTNLQALIDAQSSPLLPKNTKITHVISNKKSAFGLTRAQAAAIPTSYHNLLQYKRDAQYAGDEAKYRRAYDEDLAKLVLRGPSRPDLVVCAGFMHVLGEGFLGPLEENGVKIINLHPGMFLAFYSVLRSCPLIFLKSTEFSIDFENYIIALRAQYNGANAIERAHADFMEGKITKTGVMIHYVSSTPLSILNLPHVHDIISNAGFHVRDLFSNNWVPIHHSNSDTPQVIDVVDMGDPILQIEVPLTHPEDDDIEVLKERIHGIEHGAIVEGTKKAIEKIWEDRKAS